MLRSASAPQLVPKVVPGVLVSASAATKAKGDTAAPSAPGVQKVRVPCLQAPLGSPELDKQAAAAASGQAASSSLLQSLQSTEVAQLLDGVLATSPSVSSDAQSLLIRALGDDSAEVCQLLRRLLCGHRLTRTALALTRRCATWLPPRARPRSTPAERKRRSFCLCFLLSWTPTRSVLRRAARPCRRWPLLRGQGAPVVLCPVPTCARCAWRPSS